MSVNEPTKDSEKKKDSATLSAKAGCVSKYKKSQNLYYRSMIL